MIIYANIYIHYSFICKHTMSTYIHACLHEYTHTHTVTHTHTTCAGEHTRSHLHTDTHVDYYSVSCVASRLA